MKNAKWKAAISLAAVVFGIASIGHAAQRPATVQEAQVFIEKAEARLLDLWIQASRASWVQSNFITDDTEKLTAEAQKNVIAVTTELARAATRFDKLKLPPDTARKLSLLKLSLTLTAPSDPAAQKEVAHIAASLESDYGKGRYYPESVTPASRRPEPGGQDAGATGEKGKCLDISDLRRTALFVPPLFTVGLSSSGRGAEVRG